MLRDKYEKFKVEMGALLAAQDTRRQMLIAEHNNIEDTIKQKAKASFISSFEEAPEGSTYMYDFVASGVQVFVADPHGYLYGVKLVPWRNLE